MASPADIRILYPLVQVTILLRRQLSLGASPCHLQRIGKSRPRSTRRRGNADHRKSSFRLETKRETVFRKLGIQTRYARSFRDNS
eukprot:1180220-Prorocentrum_minimum.AAC.1